MSLSTTLSRSMDMLHFVNVLRGVFECANIVMDRECQRNNSCLD